MAETETTPTRPHDYALLMQYFSHHFAVVKGNGNDPEIRLAAPNGLWHRVEWRSGNYPAAALTSLVGRAREKWNAANDTDLNTILAPSEIPGIVHLLAMLPVIPQDDWPTGINEYRASEFNRPHLIPLHNGSVLNLKTNSTYTGASQIQNLLLTAHNSGGIRFRPDLLDNPPHAATRLAEHYGPETLDRIAHAFAAAPSREIDTYISKPSGSGKDTLLSWLQNALPGFVIARSARDYIKPQSLRFNLLETDLCNARIVFANEAGADKIDSIPANLLTHITTDRLSIEHKGQSTIILDRTANLCFIGNDAPPVEDAPGVAPRMRWQFNKGWPPMSGELRWWAVNDNDTIDWLAAYILRYAVRWHQGKQTDWSAGYITAAAAAHSKHLNPVDLLLDAGLTAGNNNDWVSADSIRNALANADFSISDTANISQWIKEISPNTGASRKRIDGINTRGYHHLAWQND